MRRLLFFESFILATAISLAPSPSPAQGLIAPGTILPISLNNSISSSKSRVGETFTGRIMQDVPLPDRRRIRAGARVVGRVTELTPATASSGARIEFKIDTLISRQHNIPMRTILRALASPLDIEDAQIPVQGADRGTSPDSYTTVQIGGDVVYRGGGHVKHGGVVVGEPVPNGVLAQVSSNEARGCPDEVPGYHAAQALWLFSADACGVYGYHDFHIVDAGRLSPDGTIALASDHGQIEIRSGSGILLRVQVTKR